MSNRDTHWMNLALDLARLAGRHQEVPVGAVIVRGEELIATGVNLRESLTDPTAHAEIVAIRKACLKLNTFDLSDCEIYSSCEPCPMCFSAIYWARIKSLYFASLRSDAEAAGFSDATIYREICLPLEERALNTKQALREESLKAFKAWNNKQDRIMY